MRDEDTARDLVEGPPEGVGTSRLVPAEVASSRICCKHVSWLSWSGIESDALARLLVSVSDATIDATPPGAMTCPRGGDAVVVVLSPWAVPRLDVEVVLFEIEFGEFEVTELEQAARTRARTPTAATTPRFTGNREEP